MPGVKRTCRRKKITSKFPNSLALTPALIREAKTIVSLYDQIDWHLVREHGCDSVHLQFQSTRSVQMAKRILLEMASVDSNARDELIAIIRGAFLKFGISGAPYSITEDTSRQRAGTAFKKRLVQITATKDPSVFAALCLKIRRLYKMKWLDFYQNKPKTHPIALPTWAAHATWFGSLGDTWISGPLRLIVAEPVVGLCRRISEINSGASETQLEFHEKKALESVNELLDAAKLQSCLIPDKDSSHPFVDKMQTILNDFVPSLRRFKDVCSVQISKTQITPEESTAPIVSKSEQASNNSIVAHVEIVPPEREVLSTHRTKRPVACIHINIKFVVIVNKARITETASASPILALAALAAPGETQVQIDTKTFVELSHRDKTGVSKRWNRDKNNLLKLGIEAEEVRHGQWALSNFNISLDPAISSQDIKAHLQGTSARVRSEKSAAASATPSAN